MVHFIVGVLVTCSLVAVAFGIALGMVRLERYLARRELALTQPLLDGQWRQSVASQPLLQPQSRQRQQEEEQGEQVQKQAVGSK